jgi:ribulose-5-phosphate 4-epimerase/fuculose-1-phosphate aldolase
LGSDDLQWSELRKVKFHSEKAESKELASKLKRSVNKYFDSFNEIGKQQHLDTTNSLKHGCYSVRLDKNWALMTCSGSNLSKLKPTDLVLVNLKIKNNTVRWHGKKLPSSEAPMHKAFYADPRVNSVIHSHNPALTYSDAYDQLKTPEYVPYGVEENMPEVVKQARKQNGFVILRYHGEVLTGKTLGSATRAAVWSAASPPSPSRGISGTRHLTGTHFTATRATR